MVPATTDEAGLMQPIIQRYQFAFLLDNPFSGVGHDTANCVGV